MTITREQVADLREGDVIEFRLDEWSSGVWIKGPLHKVATFPGVLAIDVPDSRGVYWVVRNGALCHGWESRSIIVVERAPERLYVNSDRSYPVAGDVVSGADPAVKTDVYLYVGAAHSADDRVWAYPDRHGYGIVSYASRGEMPEQLRLLVDGETGRVAAERSSS